MDPPETQPQNIILVGFMATGKTHVGRLLSQRTGWPLRDADDEIVRRAGRPIEDIFARDGEAAFRDLEHQVITDLCGGIRQTISTGGGAFVQPDNRDLMLQRGRVFCLSATPETIHARILSEADPTAPVRPLLAGDDPLRRIRDLLDRRSPAYSQAHHTIVTDGLTVAEVAEQVLACWKKAVSALESIPPVKSPEGESI